MSDIFLPSLPDDPTVQRLASLREEAETAGYELLAHLIELALIEAERIVEVRNCADGRVRASAANGGRDRD